MHAMVQGMALAIQHTDLPIIFQSGSSPNLSIFSGDSLDRSAYGHLALEVKSLLVDPEFIPQKVHRHQNRVAYCLARYSRTESSTVVWLHRGPHVWRIYFLLAITL